MTQQFLVLFLVTTSLASRGQQIVIVHSAEELLEVQQSALYFVDQSGDATISDIEQAFNRGLFKSSSQKVPNFSGTLGTIWLRLRYKSNINEELYLSFPELFFENVSVYNQTSDAGWRSMTTGFSHAYSTRALASTRYTVLLSESKEKGEHVVYVSLTSKVQPPMFIIVDLGTALAISYANRRSEFITLAVLGVLLVMLFYNFCLSIAIRDRLFLNYCAYISASILLLLWFSGLSFEWFWPDYPLYNPYPWALGPFYFTQVWFVNQLLQTREHLKFLYRFSYVLYALASLIIASFALPDGSQMLLATITGICSPIYFLTCSILLMLRRVKVAFIFLIGWLPLLLVTVLNIAMTADVVPYNQAFDKHGIELTLAWEVVIFSLVLGYRYNVMRQEKFQAQSENIRITNEQKALLRKMVFEQTEEIMSQNDQLLRNQEEIKLQNERLETQNKAYERLKELILKQNHQLESSVQKRTLQLAHSNEELKRHLHQVEQFSFISAHNLRAPVARILGLASIFDRSKVIGKENLTILDKIVLSAKDLDMIIHDLGAILDTQKNTSEKSEVIDVKELIYKILNRYESEVGKEGIHIAINTEAKYVVAIPAYLDSILSNLISNAIKYRTEVKPPMIKITTEELQSGWRIEVEDNGLGFDSKLFSRKLFEPFQRFHTHKEGKGLGMFLVKTQVTAMQGLINVESEPNKGTRVTIDIPKRTLQKSA